MSQMAERGIPGGRIDGSSAHAAGTSALSPGRLPDDRIAELELEQQQIFDDALLQADKMFAQYQLSQLLASSDSPAAMAAAVLAELARTSAATHAALWLAEPGHAWLELVTTFVDPQVNGAPVGDAPVGDTPVGGPQVSGAPVGDAPVGGPQVSGGQASGPEVRRGEANGPEVSDLPPTFVDAAAAERWSAASGWSGVTLEERRDLGELGFREQAIGFVAVGAGPGRPLEPDHARFLAMVRHELALAFRTAQLRDTLSRERATLSAILDGVGDAIIAVDGEGRIVRLNEAAGHLLGVNASSVAGLTCRAFLGCASQLGGFRCGTVCPFGEILGGAPPITNREQTVVSSDGARIPVAASYARMPGPEAGAVAVLRDLRAAHALDEMRSSFVAAVSHELRTPLALISGYVQSLLHLPLDAKTERQYLERVEATVERLGEIVTQIIDIAYIENEHLALRRFPAAVPDIVARATAELAEIPETRPVRLALEAGLPLVDVDATRIHQVLVNLVLNAIKYAGPNASIVVRAVRGPDGLVVVSVEDDGVGIDPDERGRVFERFYRGRRGRDSSIAGSGLGLYLCQRLLEAHGTWIRLEDRAVGTTVAFALPVARAKGTIA